MKQSKLGRTDLLVSEYCLDATTLGGRPPGDDATAVLDAFREAGGTFIQLHADHSDEAGECGVGARAETLVGRWLQSRHIARPEVVLSYSPHLPGNSSYFRLAAEIRTCCERALRRLGVTYLDLLLIRWTDGLPVDDTLAAADSLQRSGMFRHLGGIGFPAWRAMEWIGHADKRRLHRLDTLQVDGLPRLDAGCWGELRDLAHHQRLGLVVRPPFLDRTEERRGPAPVRPYPGLGAGGGAIAQLARERGVAPRHVALAWARADPAVSAVLVSAHTPEEIEHLRCAARLDLTLQEVNRAARPAGAFALPGLHVPEQTEAISLSHT